jgi:glycerol kinase
MSHATVKTPVEKFVLALDQGTTSSRAILFTHDGRPAAVAQQEFAQILPAPGVVEHDPETIWDSQLAVAREAIKKANATTADIAAIGVTNQRETTILWDRATGRPVANAIVWQSRVTAPICDQLKSAGTEKTIREKTGLVIDPYFSGTKIKYLLDTIPGLRARAERGEILFGTVDSFLIWRLTGGRCHVTDVTNASRTMLLNLHTLEWDDELLRLLGVPRAMLPKICSSSEIYGETSLEVFGAPIPISGCAGDQQAATFGQACFDVGSAKNTYGTGCFMLLNIGDKPVLSKSNLLTTVGWQLHGKTTYCLEGSVFVAGAVVQWLRDSLGIIKSSGDVEALAASVADSGGVIFVPAFVGLGAPHWDSSARGAIFGLTRGSTAAHIARAAVESMALQSAEVLAAMRADSHVELAHLQVDGGASINNALMQFQADILGVSVVRPVVSETTALGAAYLAGLAVGFWTSTDEVRRNWKVDRRFDPNISSDERAEIMARWQRAVERTIGWDR